MPRLQHSLPYEPGYTGHWAAERRHRETREWLRKREALVHEKEGLDLNATKSRPEHPSRPEFG